MLRVTEGLSAKGTEGTRSAYIGLEQTAGVAEARSGNRSGVEVSWKKRNGIAGRNLSTRKPQRSLVEAESNEASTNDARTRKDVDIKRKTY